MLGWTRTAHCWAYEDKGHIVLNAQGWGKWKHFLCGHRAEETETGGCFGVGTTVCRHWAAQLVCARTTLVMSSINNNSGRLTVLRLTTSCKNGLCLLLESNNKLARSLYCFYFCNINKSLFWFWVERYICRGNSGPSQNFNWTRNIFTIIYISNIMYC